MTTAQMVKRRYLRRGIVTVCSPERDSELQGSAYDKGGRRFIQATCLGELTFFSEGRTKPAKKVSKIHVQIQKTWGARRRDGTSQLRIEKRVNELPWSVQQLALASDLGGSSLPSQGSTGLATSWWMPGPKYKFPNTIQRSPASHRSISCCKIPDSCVSITAPLEQPCSFQSPRTNVNVSFDGLSNSHKARGQRQNVSHELQSLEYFSQKVSAPDGTTARAMPFSDRPGVHALQLNPFKLKNSKLYFSGLSQQTPKYSTIIAVVYLRPQSNLFTKTSHVDFLYIGKSPVRCWLTPSFAGKRN